MRNVIGLLVVALIVGVAYKYFFAKLESPQIATPNQVINVVGVKNDLLAIAQAERAYQAEHGAYASLEELTSSGALTMAKSGRDGYTYEIQSSAAGFRVMAHCPAATNPGCSDWAVDQTMEVQPAR